jgi:hypothetical protein
MEDRGLRARLSGENFARSTDFAVDELDARRANFWQAFCRAHEISRQEIAA